jgi:hypothetical protein
VETGSEEFLSDALVFRSKTVGTPMRCFPLKFDPATSAASGGCCDACDFRRCNLTKQCI